METGQSWINPTRTDYNKKCYSGDPVTGAGWIMTGGSDRRYLQSFGPFNMNPNDTQSIIVAQVIARGSSNLNSITKLSEHYQIMFRIYMIRISRSVLAVQNISTEIPEEYSFITKLSEPIQPFHQFGIWNFGFGICIS